MVQEDVDQLGIQLLAPLIPEHGGRRLDPVPGSDLVQCCSVGKSTFDHGGRPIYGAAKAAVAVYNVQLADGKLVIDLG